MNAKWFYISLAQITVLIIIIVVFFKQSQSAQATPITQSTDKVKGSGISSNEHFYFMLYDSFSSKNDRANTALLASQKKHLKIISQKNIDAKKSKKIIHSQTNKIKALNWENAKLQQKLALLKTKLLARESQSLKQQQEIERLSKVIKKSGNSRFTSEIDLVKKSIDLQPSLISSKLSEGSLSVNKNGEVVEEPVLNALTGSVQFGFSYEQDNKVIKLAKGRLILNYAEVDQYNINSDLNFEYKSENEVIGTEKYRWQLQANYNLDPTNTVFVRSDLKRSKYSSYEKEDILTLGYGHILFDNEQQKFDFEIGPGYRASSPNTGKNAISINEFIVRTRLNYDRILTDSLQLKNSVVIEAGHDNNIYSVAFKAQNRIYQELYLIFDFNYKYTQNTPIDTVNDEVSTGVSLLYAF